MDGARAMPRASSFLLLLLTERRRLLPGTCTVRVGLMCSTTTVVPPLVESTNARERERREKRRATEQNGGFNAHRTVASACTHRSMYELSIFFLLSKQQCGRAMHGEGKKRRRLASLLSRINRTKTQKIRSVEKGEGKK